MARNNHQTGLAYFLLTVSVILWASAFSAIRSALGSFSPDQLALLRFLTASLFLAIVLILNKSKFPALQDIVTFSLAGLIGISLYHYLLNLGEKTVLAGTAGFLISTIPVFTALLGHFFLKEKLSVKRWIGLFVSLAGIAIISFSGSAFGEFHTGILLVILASLSGSIYVIFQKKLLVRYTALEVTAYTIFTGTIFLLVSFPGLIRSFETAQTRHILEAVYLGVFPAALAYLFWTYALNKIQTAAQVSAFLYITPVFSLIIAYFWLHEIPPLSSLAGGILILCGVILTNSISKHHNN